MYLLGEKPSAKNEIGENDISPVMYIPSLKDTPTPQFFYLALVARSDVLAEVWDFTSIIKHIKKSQFV